MHDAPPGLDAQRLLSLARVGAVALSPCGAWLAVEVQRLDPEGGRFVSDLWAVHLDGSSPSRLTRGRWSDSAPAFRADGALGFLSNRPTSEGKPGEGHDKRKQVWILPAHGEPTPLTDEPLGVTSFQFASRGDRLVFMANLLPGVALDEQRDAAEDRRKHGPSARRYTTMPVRRWDHWIPEAAPHLIATDQAGEGRTDLTPDPDRAYRYTSWDLSPDGSMVAVAARIQAPDRIPSGHLRLIDTASGDARTIPLAEPGASVASPRVSPDGRTVATIHNVRSAEAVGANRLWLVDVDSGEGRFVARDWDRWPTVWGWTPDGSQLLITADDLGYVPAYAVDVATGARTRVTHPDAGGTHAHLISAPDGARLVGVRSRITHPPEPFTVPLAEGQQPELLASLSGFSPEEGESIAHIEYTMTPSTDGVACQSFLVRPRHVTAPAPMVLWIHGGPMGQWGDGWHWRWNSLVGASQGYAMALPNPRGSTGAGQDFIEGIWGNTWGGQCFDDLMAITDALTAHDAIDAERVAAMGGSFGGYMTNWIGTQTDRFRCLITHASIFSMAMFQGVTDLPAWWRLSMGGLDPVGHPEAYNRYSPEHHVDGWTTPAMILHGDLDYRVPVGEALALFEALQVRGVESELIIWPDENHWILKPRNIVSWYEHVLRFLHAHLGAEATPDPEATS
ncbi:MAG: S9 family peptidase [Myxococcales bacterium]|nr:S9 family peptidase [Myxococcales bacterium]